MYHAPDEDHGEEPEERPSLAFEAEFDGVRRSVTPCEEPLFDPDRYWRLNSGTD